MTSIFDGWPWKTIENLFHPPKSYVSFHSHPLNQIGVMFRRHSNQSQIYFSARMCNLEIFQLTPENNNAPFHTPRSYVCHFTAIWESKLELFSGNAQIRAKSWLFGLCDLEIWWMTSQNNRTPLLCHLKLWASFCNNLWIQTGVTVPKRSIGVKIINFSAHVTLKFEGWPKKTIGHLFKLCA